MATTPRPPPDDKVSRKQNSGNRTDRRNRNGRERGVRNRRTRETDELLKKLGSDPPHVALLKIGRNRRNAAAIRVSAFSHAAPFFAAKPSPAPTPNYLEGSPELGKLTDAASALRFTSAVTEQVRDGKLDLVFGEFFLKAADLFTRLYERVELETEVERTRELDRVKE
jgi:hypothetical protein